MEEYDLLFCLWLKGNISSPLRYSYFSILPVDNADIFAASLLWYDNCKRFFLNYKGLLGEIVASKATK